VAQVTSLGQSRSTHRLVSTLTELSRRDDLESLMYSLLFLLLGGLPWRKIAETHKGSFITRMGRTKLLKERMNGAKLVAEHHLPVEWGRVYDCIKTLAFDETPLYAQYQNLFRDVWDQHGFTDFELTWEPSQGTY